LPSAEEMGQSLEVQGGILRQQEQIEMLWQYGIELRNELKEDEEIE